MQYSDYIRLEDMYCADELNEFYSEKLSSPIREEKRLALLKARKDFKQIYLMRGAYWKAYED